MERLSYGAALIFVATLPWERLVSFGPLGSLARVVGLVSGAVWLLKIVGDRRLRAPSGLHILMAVMLAWTGLSMNWSADPARTRSTFVTVIMLFVLTYMIWDLVNSRARVIATIQSFVLGAAVPVFLVLEARLSTSDAGARLSAASFHPNDLAMVLSLAIPLAGYLAFREEASHLVRICNFLMVPLSVFAALMTGSRSGLFAVSLGVGYVLVLAVRNFSAAKSAAMIALVLAPLALLPVVADRLLQRLLGTGEALTTDLNGRTEIWLDALTIFNQRPLTGTGAGAFENSTIATQPPHNIFISYGAELGALGIILIVALLVLVGYKALQTPHDMRAMWFIVLLAWGSNALFHNIEYRKQTWLIFALVVVASEITRQLEQEHPSLLRAPSPAWAGY